MRELLVVDYGAGNLPNVVRAFVSLGSHPSVTSDPRDVDDARALVLPGVGAAGQIMRSLHELELDEAIQRYVAAGRPFLGVCMGMQVLLDWSDEDGGQRCLGVFEGTVQRLDVKLKVPHMGWNAVHQTGMHPMWTGIPDGSYFYFVHSYAARPRDPAVQVGTTNYDGPFASALARDNVFGTQFHPEKSGRVGLQLYRNFLTWASKSSRP
jgi:glutamine amidotransferase